MSQTSSRILKHECPTCGAASEESCYEWVWVIPIHKSKKIPLSMDVEFHEARKAKAAEAIAKRLIGPDPMDGWQFGFTGFRDMVVEKPRLMFVLKDMQGV